MQRGHMMSIAGDDAAKQFASCYCRTGWKQILRYAQDDPGREMTTRRDFLKHAGAAAALTAAGSTLLSRLGHASPPPVYPRGYSSFEEIPIKELLAETLNAAKAAGATWADVRIGR